MRRGSTLASMHDQTSEWDEFPGLLNALRERRGLSMNELARAVGVDPSYISRLERGEREPPRRRVVEALGQVLQLGIDEQDRLLVSAGFAPATVALLGRWDPSLQSVAEILLDRRLSETEHESFRRVVDAVVEHWRFRLE